MPEAETKLISNSMISSMGGRSDLIEVSAPMGASKRAFIFTSTVNVNHTFDTLIYQCLLYL